MAYKRRGYSRRSSYGRRSGGGSYRGRSGSSRPQVIVVNAGGSGVAPAASTVLSPLEQRYPKAT